MLLNEHTALLTPRLLLVPYSARHVPRYHEWMKDEELQTATASEPLTLEEEYAMQRSWRRDADKLTFIVCAAPPDPNSIRRRGAVEPGVDDTEESMFGDVNLFLVEDDEEEEEEGVEEKDGEGDGAGAAPKVARLIGEIEIMIAQKQLQGQGYGRAILAAFLWYILTHLDDIVGEYSKRDGQLNGVGKLQRCALRHLRAKIDSTNTRSIRLFESVGFQLVSETPNYFGEVELRWQIEGKDIASLTNQLQAAMVSRAGPATKADHEPEVVRYGSSE